MLRAGVLRARRGRDLHASRSTRTRWCAATSSPARTASTPRSAADDLDALVAPTGSPAWPTDLVNGDHFLGASSGPAAMAGYPIVNVPMGFAFDLPVGISFFGTA